MGRAASRSVCDLCESHYNVAYPVPSNLTEKKVPLGVNLVCATEMNELRNALERIESVFDSVIFVVLYPTPFGTVWDLLIEK